MKYITSYIGNIDEELNSMLGKGIQNDILLDTKFIIVEMELSNKQDIIACAYRFLWEAVYLRRHDTDIFSKYYVKDNKPVCKFAVSLSEAINYIMNVSPPTNKEKIKNHLNSIENIHSLLAYYLKDTTAQNLGGVNGYASAFSEYKRTANMFKVALNCQRFNTVWNYNNKRFDIIAMNIQSNDKSFVGVIDFASLPIKELVNPDRVLIQDKTQFSLRVSLKDKRGLSHLIKFLDDDMRVINVSLDEDYLYLTIYSTRMMISKFGKWVSKWYNV